jgi:DNA primase
MIDAIYFWTVGKYAVALNGLGNELQFKQLKEMPCRKFILCTDSDDAGMRARSRIRKNIRNKLITEYVLPSGRKDANDCTQDELISLQEVF